MDPAGEERMAARREIVGVQYLRGIAAVAVVLCHAASAAVRPGYYGTSTLGGVLDSGRIGADLFFLISGFVITIVSLDGPALAPRIARREFFLRRFTRIVPLMWLAILVFAAIRLSGNGHSGTMEYLRAAFLLPWGEVRPQVIWTLRQELIFYLVFALAMLGSRRWRFTLLLWLLMPVVTGMRTVMPSDTPHQMLFILGHGSTFEFAAGMLIGILWLKRGEGPTIELPVPALPVLALAFALPLGATIAGDLGFGYRLPPLSLALLCAPVLFLGVHVECQPGSSDRFGRLLGDASYSIYLFHLPLFYPLTTLLARLALPLPEALVVALLVLIATAGGIAIHLWIERPLIAAARRLFAPREAVRMEPVAPH